MNGAIAFARPDSFVAPRMNGGEVAVPTVAHIVAFDATMAGLVAIVCPIVAGHPQPHRAV